METVTNILLKGAISENSVLLNSVSVSLYSVVDTESTSQALLLPSVRIPAFTLNMLNSSRAERYHSLSALLPYPDTHFQLYLHSGSSLHHTLTSTPPRTTHYVFVLKRDTYLMFQAPRSTVGHSLLEVPFSPPQATRFPSSLATAGVLRASVPPAVPLNLGLPPCPGPPVLPVAPLSQGASTFLPPNTSCELMTLRTPPQPCLLACAQGPCIQQAPQSQPGPLLPVSVIDNIPIKSMEQASRCLVWGWWEE